MMEKSQCSKLKLSSVNAALALLQVLNKSLLPLLQPLLSHLHNSHNSLLVRSLPEPRLSQSKMFSLSSILEVLHLIRRRHPKATQTLLTIGVVTGVTLVTRPSSRLSPPRMSINSLPSSLSSNRCNSNPFSSNPSQRRTCLTISSTLQQLRPSLQAALCPTDSNLIKWAAINLRPKNLQATPSKTSSVLTLPMVPSRTTSTRVWVTKVKV
jgi:hypothetical protein